MLEYISLINYLLIILKILEDSLKFCDKRRHSDIVVLHLCICEVLIDRVKHPRVHERSHSILIFVQEISSTIRLLHEKNDPLGWTIFGKSYFILCFSASYFVEIVQIKINRFLNTLFLILAA